MDQKRDIRMVNAPNSDSAAQPYYNKSWALVIGISKYRDSSLNLANARNDAVAVADLLTNVYKFEHVHKLLDEDATSDAILDWLRDKLPNQMVHNDRLVIFFAGHGTTRESIRVPKQGYLIPYEAVNGRFADYIDMVELHRACGSIPAKHILAILDCCFSGIAAVTARTTPTYRPITTLTENYIRRITERGAWQVLTAGAEDELVADSGRDLGHSAFTSALLAGLNGSADHNRDGVITASDLAAFVKPEVIYDTTNAGGKGQMPFFSYLAGSEQGDFVLINPSGTLKLEDTPLHQSVESVTSKVRSSWLWGALIFMSILLAVVGWFARDIIDPSVTPSPSPTSESIAEATSPPPTDASTIELGDILFRLSIGGCSMPPEQRIQTAFRIKGIGGLVTALHGVAGCNEIQAISENRSYYLRSLYIDQVDIDGDIAILQSPALEELGIEGGFVSADTWVFPPCTQFGDREQGEVFVVGYPLLNISLSKVPGYANCVRPLEERVTTPELKDALIERGSPSLMFPIIDIQGIDIAHGHSGSPVLVEYSDGKMGVVGVVIGRLIDFRNEVTVPGNGWAVLWNQIDLTPSSVEESRISELGNLGPNTEEEKYFFALQ